MWDSLSPSHIPCLVPTTQQRPLRKGRGHWKLNPIQTLVKRLKGKIGASKMAQQAKTNTKPNQSKQTNKQKCTYHTTLSVWVWSQAPQWIKRTDFQSCPLILLRPYTQIIIVINKIKIWKVEKVNKIGKEETTTNTREENKTSRSRNLHLNIEVYTISSQNTVPKMPKQLPCP